MGPGADPRAQAKVMYSWVYTWAAGPGPLTWALRPMILYLGRDVLLGQGPNRAL